MITMEVLVSGNKTEPALIMRFSAFHQDQTNLYFLDCLVQIMYPGMKSLFH